MEKSMDETQSYDLRWNKSRNFTEKVARIAKHQKFEHFLEDVKSCSLEGTCQCRRIHEVLKIVLLQFTKKKNET